MAAKRRVVVLRVRLSLEKHATPPYTGAVTRRKHQVRSNHPACRMCRTRQSFEKPASQESRANLWPGRVEVDALLKLMDDEGCTAICPPQHVERNTIVLPQLLQHLDIVVASGCMHLTCKSIPVPCLRGRVCTLPLTDRQPSVQVPEWRHRGPLRQETTACPSAMR